MTWRDQQGPARFRTAEFISGVADLSSGRRLVEHEIPFSEDPSYFEDLGKAPDEFTVEGFVIGDDYRTKRDALRAALDTKGPGELLHPFYGLVTVVAGTYRVREDTDREGGLARFSITFKRAQANPVAPVAVVDAAGAVVESASAARVSVAAQFNALYAATARYRTAVSGALTKATRAIDSLTGIQELASEDLARLKGQIATITDSAASLVNSPTDLLDSMVDLIGGVAASLVTAAQVPESFAIGAKTAVGVRAPFRALLSLFDADMGSRPAGGTVESDRERDSFDAFTRLVQRAAIIVAAESVISQEFDSYDAATSARDEITSRIDEHLEQVSDDTFDAFTDLRASLVALLPGAESDLPRLVTYTPPATVSSLVLAHRLYGSIDLERDVVERNNVRNPALILGGRSLQVLSNG